MGVLVVVVVGDLGDGAGVETSTDLGMETTLAFPAETMVIAWAWPHCRSVALWS